MKQKTTNNKMSKKTILVDDDTVSHNGSSKKMKQKTTNNKMSQKTILVDDNTVSHNGSSKKIKQEKNKEKSQFSHLYVVGFTLFHKRASFLFPRLERITESLEQAMMPIPYEVYVCGMVIFSLIAGAVGLVAGIGISLVFAMQLEFSILLPIVLALSFAQITFLVMIKVPHINAGIRSGKIESELPFFTSYMSSLATSNLTLEEIFKRLAADNIKYEIVKDAHHLLRNIDLFGVDILSALADLRNRTTCDAYSELLDGLVSTIYSGGSMKSFFISAAVVQMTEKKMKLRKKIASLGVITEMYTILLIVAPLMGIIMLSIMAIMSTSFAGMDITSLVALLTYLLVPIFGIMLLLMIDGMVPKR